MCAQARLVELAGPKTDQAPMPARKCVIEVALEVGREDEDSLVALDSLRQVADIHVDVPVLRTQP